MNLAPVLIFCYKRLDTLKIAIESLKNNYLAKATDLYIFSDAAKTDKDKEIVNSVRLYLKSISGFKSITIIESPANKGLAKSVITGVTNLIERFDKVIVVEDDLETSANFLNYMNEALNFYKNNPEVFSISGYSFNLKIPKDYKSDVYFTKRSSSWGWATWKDRWEKVDWTMKDFEETSWTLNRKLDFNKMGSDLYSMLKRQYLGKIDSWAIRFCFHQYLINGLTVFPTISKVQNIGFGENATHTSGYNNFSTILDSGQNTNFYFCEPEMNPKLIRQFAAKRGYIERIKGKLINLLQ